MSPVETPSSHWLFKGVAVGATNARFTSIWCTSDFIRMRSARTASTSSLLIWPFADCVCLEVAAESCFARHGEIVKQSNKKRIAGLADIFPPPTPADRLPRRLGGDVVFEPLAALHDKSYILQGAHVSQRIAGHGNDVGVLAWLDCAYVLGAPDQVGSATGRRANRLHRRHAKLHHVEELLGVVAMRIDSSVGAERHLRAGFECFFKVFALQAADHLFLLYVFLGKPKLRSLIENVIVVIDIHDEISAMLLRHADAFFVNQAGVLD